MPGQNQKEVDFSNYFKNQPKNSSGKSQVKPKFTGNRSTNVRLVILVIIMLGMIGGLAYLLYQNSQKNIVKVPAGYQPTGTLGRLEKIK